MAKVEGISLVVASLEDKKLKKPKATVNVGYTQSYAVWVHERMDTYHPVGQAKFLEQPAREKAGEIARIIKETYRKTKDLTLSLLTGGLFLQRESQKLVPVDTGALKASAFTRVE